jgi:hypothetical protein
MTHDSALERASGDRSPGDRRAVARRHVGGRSASRRDLAGQRPVDSSSHAVPGFDRHRTPAASVAVRRGCARARDRLLRPAVHRPGPGRRDRPCSPSHDGPAHDRLLPQRRRRGRPCRTRRSTGLSHLSSLRPARTVSAAASRTHRQLQAPRNHRDSRPGHATSTRHCWVARSAAASSVVQPCGST